MSLAPLRALLKQEYSREVCVKILSETSGLYREDLPNRWYVLLLILAGITSTNRRGAGPGSQARALLDDALIARREVLKYQLHCECFRETHDAVWRKQW